MKIKRKVKPIKLRFPSGNSVKVKLLHREIGSQLKVAGDLEWSYTPTPEDIQQANEAVRNIVEQLSGIPVRSLESKMIDDPILREAITSQHLGEGLN